MPTVILNTKSLEKLIGKKIEVENICKLISYIGASVEAHDEKTITVEVCPNRPDLLSEQGMGRALSSFIGLKTGLARFPIIQSTRGEYTVIVEESVKEGRPFTACAVVKGLVFDDEKIKEIIQIQEKLHVTYGRNRKKCAIGVYPLDKIKFPVRFVAQDPSKISFVPLESPGNRKMTGLQVLSMHPTGKEFSHLMEGLTKFPFFIDAKNEVLSMPPIINSHNVGKIEHSTKDVFVECSGFDQKVLDICLNMVVSALSDMGGTIHSVLLQNKHANFEKHSPAFETYGISCDVNYVNKILGLELKPAKVHELLACMGYGFDNKKQEAIVPSYRCDVLHPIDLVEDIAIAYGFEEFKPSIPACATVGGRDGVEVLRAKVADILVGLSIFESNTYCLIGKDLLAASSDRSVVALANSVAEGYDALRNNVLSSLLLALQNNRNRDYPQGFFEIGYTFLPTEKTDTKILEGRELAIISASATADFTTARQFVDYLCNNLSVTVSFRKPHHCPIQYIEGRVAEVVVDDEAIGLVGQISPKVLSTFGVEMPAAGAQIDFLKLVHKMRK